MALSKFESLLSQVADSWSTPTLEVDSVTMTVTQNPSLKYTPGLTKMSDVPIITTSTPSILLTSTKLLSAILIYAINNSVKMRITALAALAADPDLIKLINNNSKTYPQLAAPIISN